jgi:hypothetical protein
MSAWNELVSARVAAPAAHNAMTTGSVLSATSADGLDAFDDDSTASSGLSSELFDDGMIDNETLTAYDELDQLEPEKVAMRKFAEERERIMQRKKKKNRKGSQVTDDNDDEGDEEEEEDETEKNIDDIADGLLQRKLSPRQKMLRQKNQKPTKSVKKDADGRSIAFSVARSRAVSSFRGSTTSTSKRSSVNVEAEVVDPLTAHLEAARKKEEEKGIGDVSSLGGSSNLDEVKDTEETRDEGDKKKAADLAAAASGDSAPNSNEATQSSSGQADQSSSSKEEKSKNDGGKSPSPRTSRLKRSAAKGKEKDLGILAEHFGGEDDDDDDEMDDNREDTDSDDDDDDTDTTATSIVRWGSGGNSLRGYYAMTGGISSSSEARNLKRRPRREGVKARRWPSPPPKIKINPQDKVGSDEDDDENKSGLNSSNNEEMTEEDAAAAEAAVERKLAYAFAQRETEKREYEKNMAARRAETAALRRRERAVVKARESIAPVVEQFEAAHLVPRPVLVQCMRHALSGSLEEMDLSHYGLGDEYGLVLAAGLKGGLKGSGANFGGGTSLKVIRLRGNRMGLNSTAALVASLPRSLTHLDLSHNIVDARALGFALGGEDKEINKITRPHKVGSDNTVKDADAHSVTSEGPVKVRLALPPNLEILELEGAGLGASGMCNLESGIRAQLGALRQLDLGRNALTEEGAWPIGRLLAQASNGERSKGKASAASTRRMTALARMNYYSLTHLFLGWNELGARGVDALLRPNGERSMNITLSLTVLDLSWNAIGSPAALERGQYPAPSPAAALSTNGGGAVAAPTASGFEDSIEPGVSFEDSIEPGVRSLALLLQTSRTLWHLSLAANEFTPLDVSILSDALAHNRTLVGVHFDRNRGGYMDAEGFLRVAPEPPDRAEEKQRAARLSAMKSRTVKMFQNRSRPAAERRAGVVGIPRISQMKRTSVHAFGGGGGGGAGFILGARARDGSAPTPDANLSEQLQHGPLSQTSLSGTSGVASAVESAVGAETQGAGDTSNEEPGAGATPLSPIPADMPSIRPLTAPIEKVVKHTPRRSSLKEEQEKKKIEGVYRPEPTAAEEAAAMTAPFGAPSSSPCPLCARWVLYDFKCETPKHLKTTLCGFKVSVFLGSPI